MTWDDAAYAWDALSSNCTLDNPEEDGVLNLSPHHPADRQAIAELLARIGATILRGPA